MLKFHDECNDDIEGNNDYYNNKGNNNIRINNDDELQFKSTDIEVTTFPKAIMKKTSTVNNIEKLATNFEMLK